MRHTAILLAVFLFLTQAAMALDPDLRIRDVHLHSQALSPGETYEVSFVLENASGARLQTPWSFSVSIPSGGTFVSMVPLSNDQYGPYTCNASGGTVVCMAAKPQHGGVSTAMSVNFTAGGGVNSGGSIQLTADPSNTVQESNEGNNNATVSYFPRPDLAVTALTYGPNPPRRGQEIKVEVAFKNVGPVSIRYERLTVRLSGPSPFKIVRTEPTTNFPTTGQTSANIEFYPGFLNVGDTGAVRVYLQTDTVQRMNFQGTIKSFDSQGRDYESKTSDNRKSVDVDVVQVQ